MDKVSVFEIMFLAVTLAASGVMGYLLQPMIHGDNDAMNLIATVFSILAGLLIGIVTLLSDSAIVPGKTWRGAVLAKPILLRRLYRHRLLFLVYLVTLALIFAAMLLDNRSGRAVPWIERAYLFFASVGFAYSLRLPWTLAKIQEERLDALIEERRRQAPAAKDDE